LAQAFYLVWPCLYSILGRGSLTCWGEVGAMLGYGTDSPLKVPAHVVALATEGRL